MPGLAGPRQALRWPQSEHGLLTAPASLGSWKPFVGACSGISCCHQLFVNTNRGTSFVTCPSRPGAGRALIGGYFRTADGPKWAAQRREPELSLESGASSLPHPGHGAGSQGARMCRAGARPSASTSTGRLDASLGLRCRSLWQPRTSQIAPRTRVRLDPLYRQLQSG